MNIVYVPSAQRILSRILAGQDVLEVGGAYGQLARVMVDQFKARSVMVVEKDTQWKPRAKEGSGVTFYWGYLQQFLQLPTYASRLWSVCVCSWPINQPEFERGLIQVMRQSAQVVIIGHNDGVTACGTDLMWRYLMTRQRLNYVQDDLEDLVVYGPNPRMPSQAPCSIERYGLGYSDMAQFAGHAQSNLN